LRHARSAPVHAVPCPVSSGGKPHRAAGRLHPAAHQHSTGCAAARGLSHRLHRVPEAVPARKVDKLPRRIETIPRAICPSEANQMVSAAGLAVSRPRQTVFSPGRYRRSCIFGLGEWGTGRARAGSSSCAPRPPSPPPGTAAARALGENPVERKWGARATAAPAVLIGSLRDIA
jgi:hypothetical protein